MDVHAELVRPMREELTRAGFTELRTAEEVDRALGERAGTTLVFVNSVCGCAAGMARPGAVLALARARLRPDRLLTVFAGQDREATARARAHFAEAPPSSPSIALLKDGALVAFVPRHRIEGRSAEDVATTLVQAFAEHCVPVA